LDEAVRTGGSTQVGAQRAIRTVERQLLSSPLKDAL
jgi:hypothetical protein